MKSIHRRKAVFLWKGEFMERLRRINETIVKRYSMDRFAVQQILKHLHLQYEYRIEGEWISGPPSQKPTGKRAIIDRYSFDRAKETYLAWEEIQKRKQFRTERPEEVIARLLSGSLNGSLMPLILFVPWGVRPEGKIRFEKRVIDMIADFRDTIRTKGVGAEVIFMPADVYATEINQINKEKAIVYFEEVATTAYLNGFNVRPWSQIRDDNKEMYKKRADELTPQVITDILGYGKILEAFGTAKRRSGYSSQSSIERAAFAYLRERICEAEIIESVYKPIKISAVSKNKDNGVDRDLPRIYIIPERFQFPWLK